MQNAIKLPNFKIKRATVTNKLVKNSRLRFDQI